MDWFLPWISTMKKYCKFIGQETSSFSHILALITISLRYQLLPSRYWWSQNRASWLSNTHTWPHIPEKVILDANFFWWTYIHIKKVRYQLILSRDISKEYYNLIGWKAQLATLSRLAVSNALFPQWLFP